MKDHRRGDDRDGASNGGRNFLDRIARTELLWSEYRDRPPRKPRIDEGGLSDPYHVANEDRSESRRAQADEREERKRVEGPAHVIEQMIASAVDDP